MRIRTVKPEYFTHPSIVRLSLEARLLLLSLLTQADDEGRLYDQPRKIGGNAFGDEDDVDTDAVLDELDTSGRILRYEADGRRCIQVVGFTDHQRISKPKASVIQPRGESATVPGRVAESAGTPPGPGSDASATATGGNGKERKGKGKELDLKARQKPRPKQSTKPKYNTALNENQPYLLAKVRAAGDAWQDVTIRAIAKLNGDYSFAVVTEALQRALEEPTAPRTSGYALLEAMCKDIAAKAVA